MFRIDVVKQSCVREGDVCFTKGFIMHSLNLHFAAKTFNKFPLVGLNKNEDYL